MRRIAGILFSAYCISPIGLCQTGGVPEYRVEYLGGAIFTRGMNELGDCVGSDYPPFEIGYPWVSLDGAATQPLPLPPGMATGEAFDINDLRQVVGWVSGDSGGGSTAVVWTLDESGEYQATLLGAIPGFGSSRAVAINNLGDILGKASAPSGAARPVLFTPSGNIDLAVVYGFPTSLVEDINDRREIVGISYRMDLDTGVVESGFGLSIRATNEVGQLAGTIANPPQNLHAVRWTEGIGVEILTIITTPFTVAKSINDFGDVAFEPDAVHLNGIGSFGLHELIAPEYGTWVFEGNWHDMEINNSRQVLTIASNPSAGLHGAVRLTPIREPRDRTDRRQADPGSLSQRSVTFQ